MKTLASLSLVALFLALSGAAHADESAAGPNFSFGRPVPPPPMNVYCMRAQRQLADAYQGLQNAQAMANNSVAICGQSASCYAQIAAAVNMNQQAVANAQQQVRMACGGGWGRR